MIRIFLSMLCLLCFQCGYSQTPESLLEKLRKDYNEEKIYIHYDKSSYIAGETIWFKAYLLEDVSPAAQSTILSVELVSNDGSLLKKNILPIIGSSASGNFDLPKDIQGGTYKVRAYTRLMMNFGSESFYYHSFNVYNPSITQQGAMPSPGLSVQFLPEGGNIVADAENTIAFKCTDAKGIPEEVAGIVKDSPGNVLASFKSAFQGMGKFKFIPAAGVKYFAECTFKNGDKKQFALPEVQVDGAAFSLTMSRAKGTLHINKSKVINQELMPDYILGVIEKRIAFRMPLDFSSSQALDVVIPFANMPSGILQITAFNSKNIPLAERLAFINSGDYNLQGNFKVVSSSLGARKKNSFSFELEDTLAGTFSVAITDVDAEIGDGKYQDNIVSHFLLTGELKGDIYKPGYYFESDDEEHMQNLDFVMLTTGWRRYKWNEIMMNRFPSMTFKDLNYITLAGTAFEPLMNKPLLNTDLNVFIKTKANQSDFFIVKTSPEGKFEIPGMMFEDSAKFSFQKNSEKAGKIHILLSSSYIGGNFNVPLNMIPSAIYAPLTPEQSLKVNNSLKTIIAANGSGILLDEVIVNTKIKSKSQKFEDKYVSGIVGGTASRTLDFIKDPPTGFSSNILEYLKSKIAGVNISGGPISYSVNFRNAMSLGGGMIPMNIFVDETQVQPEMASSIELSQVAMVKVYSSGPFAGAGGALAIYTKKGEDFVPSGYTELSTFKVEGFTPSKEFYAPDYTAATDANILRDERTTLYWDTNLDTDHQHKKISFSFYNSDKAKRFRIILEGMTEDGELLHIERIIQ